MPTPTRRQMLGAIALPVLSVACAPVPPPVRLRATPAPHASGPPDAVARDEEFWVEIARNFTIDRSVVNLNNGGVSPSPSMVQEATKRHLDFANSAPPPYALWQIAPPLREAVRERLATH